MGPQWRDVAVRCGRVGWGAREGMWSTHINVGYGWWVLFGGELCMRVLAVLVWSKRWMVMDGMQRQRAGFACRAHHLHPPAPPPRPRRWDWEVSEAYGGGNALGLPDDPKLMMLAPGVAFYAPTEEEWVEQILKVRCGQGGLVRVG